MSLLALDEASAGGLTPPTDRPTRQHHPLPHQYATTATKSRCRRTAANEESSSASAAWGSDVRRFRRNIGVNKPSVHPHPLRIHTRPSHQTQRRVRLNTQPAACMSAGLGKSAGTMLRLIRRVPRIVIVTAIIRHPISAGAQSHRPTLRSTTDTATSRPSLRCSTIRRWPYANASTIERRNCFASCAVEYQHNRHHSRLNDNRGVVPTPPAQTAHSTRSAGGKCGGVATRHVASRRTQQSLRRRLIHLPTSTAADRPTKESPPTPGDYSEPSSPAHARPNHVRSG